MNIAKRKLLAGVEAFELGFGPVGPPWLTVHFYHLDGIVIDTGQHHMQKHAIDLLKNKSLHTVLLTHHHEDHSGNADAISRHYGIPVKGDSLTAEKLRCRFPILPYQHYTWGKSRPVDIRPLEPVIDTGNYRIKPLHTPGHSKDHTVYLEENNGWLFSGDLYLGERIKYFRSDEKFYDQIVSIEKVLHYDFDSLFCAHNPCLKGGKEKLRGKLQYLQDLYGKVQRLKARGFSIEKTLSELNDRRDRIVKLVTFGNVSFANMVRSAYYS